MNDDALLAALGERISSLAAELIDIRRDLHAHPELAWTESRIHALNGRKSWLNPVWYAGAFALAYATAKVGGERISLGFVVETERQVEAHLRSHLALLPAGDTASLAVVKAMAQDEAQHAREAQRAGAAELPEPLKRLMALSGRVMTTVAHRV